MVNIPSWRNFCRFILILPILPVVNPCISIAQDQVPEYQGYYSSKLKSRMKKTNSSILENLKRYKKDKSVERLDESYNVIIQAVDEMDIFLKTAIQQLQDIPDSEEVPKLKAQIDKLEIINIRDVELPYLCDRLNEVGRLYVKADKKKAKQCFRYILNKFASYESDGCRRKAEYALKHLK